MGLMKGENKRMRKIICLSKYVGQRGRFQVVDFGRLGGFARTGEMILAMALTCYALCHR